VRLHAPGHLILATITTVSSHFTALWLKIEATPCREVARRPRDGERRIHRPTPKGPRVLRDLQMAAVLGIGGTVKIWVRLYEILTSRSQQ